jgi:hypothetical protein
MRWLSVHLRWLASCSVRQVWGKLMKSGGIGRQALVAQAKLWGLMAGSFIRPSFEQSAAMCTAPQLIRRALRV